MLKIHDYPNISIVSSKDNIRINDSYLICDDKDKKEIIDALKKAFMDCPRSKESMLREWKVHNAFYQRGWFMKSTKDVDLEYRQTFPIKLIYFIANMFIKERKDR